VPYPLAADAAALATFARTRGADLVVVHARRRPPVGPGLALRAERCAGRRRLAILQVEAGGE
jgi:hypothetical protein